MIICISSATSRAIQDCAAEKSVPLKHESTERRKYQSASSHLCQDPEACVVHNQKTQPCLNGARLGTKIVSHKGLVGRSTSVYHLECTNYHLELVVKYSWQIKTHRREDTITREARQADAVHTPELFGTVVVDDPSPFETLRNACSRKSKRHEPRELRVLVIRRYRPLTELGFGEEFWDVFGQLLGCKSIFRSEC